MTEPEVQTEPEVATATSDTAEPDFRQRILWGVLVFGVCLITALVVTWPLAAHLDSAILLGNEQGAMVGLLSIWTLWWNADRLVHGFAGYWDAPFFYPNKGVFTYSEPEPLTALFIAPLWGLDATPSLVHNVASLLVLTLNGIFAYRLARALGVKPLPALLGGVLMVALPFVAKVYGVLNLTPVFGMLWTLEGLVRFGRAGRLRDAAWAGLGFIAAYLTCQQYALIFVPFALGAFVVALWEQRFARRAILVLVASFLGAGLLLLLVILPAYTLHQQLGLTRQDFVVQALSAQLGDFFTRPNTASVPFPPASLNDTAGLFPGFILLGLATLGVGLAWHNRESSRRWAVYLAVGTFAAALLAMGLNLSIFGWQPFDTMRSFIPGFSELRSPFRFAIIMQLMLAALAALGLGYLLVYLRDRKQAGIALVVLLGLLGAAENLNVPVPLQSIPTSAKTAWVQWLKVQPQGTMVAHVPFPNGLRITDYEIEGWRMFAQIEHQMPIVNGYSGYFPPGYTDFQLSMATGFPSQGLICELNLGLGANTLVVDQSWLATHLGALASFASSLQPVYSDKDVQIYRLAAPADVCKANEQSP